MIMNKKVLYSFSLLLFTLLLTSCKNGDADFPDYEKGVSVYFANQYPVRTLEMGEDEYDTTLDNQHKCQIQATMGGSYNGRDITLELEVDNSLCKNLYFTEDETSILPMPKEYYDLSSTTMRYEGFVGKIEVTLKDAFFNDAKALEGKYVIPVSIKNQVGAERILTGTPVEEGTNPQHTWAEKWITQPKDFTLYAVKYICKYDANYLRRGSDQITVGGTTKTVTRNKGEWEKEEVKNDITTLSLNAIKYPVTVDVNGTKKSCNLKITFGNDDKVTSIVSLTDGVTVTAGSGEYKTKSEIKAWNNKDRDGLYLDYTLDFGGGVTVKTSDVLCWQSRGVSKENFTVIYKESN